MRRGAIQVWGPKESTSVFSGEVLLTNEPCPAASSDLLTQVTSYRRWWLYPKLVADGKGHGEVLTA